MLSFFSFSLRISFTTLIGWWVGIDAGGGKSNVSVRLFAFFEGWQFSLLLFTNHSSILLFILSLHVTDRRYGADDRRESDLIIACYDP